MFEFLKSTDNVVQKMLKHIKTTSITDIIMKLISMEDIPEGMGVVDVRYLSKNEWLAEQGLIEKLVEYFDPRNGSFLHALASQAILDIIAISFNVDPSFYPQDQSSYNSLKSQLIDKLRSKLVLEKLVGYMTDRSHEDSKSSLTHGINIIMELVRRYCS
jgi:serine/threonine-protein phosphatase 6 regulatory subunit 3